MKHLLDYRTLEKYGFVWATKEQYEGIDYCDSYLLNDSPLNHNIPIYLSMFSSPLKNYVWVIGYINSDALLFKGVIRNKEELETILKCCVFIYN